MIRIVLAAMIAAAMAAPAAAIDVAAGQISVDATDATQQGRLSRNGVPQDWANDEQFPGTINANVTYHYTSVAVPFAANVRQPVYYDVTIDDVAKDLFASAYLDTYDPMHKDVNWLGDAGTSGNYFGTDVLYFDVVVPRGGTLLLVFNSTTATLPTSTAAYLVGAFSDNMYDETFLPGVPEPATWAMMVAGFGMIGGAVRRAGRRTARA